MSRVARSRWLVLACAFVLNETAQAQPRVAVSQAVYVKAEGAAPPFGDHLLAYLRLKDGDAVPPLVQPSALSALLDTAPLVVDAVTPFDGTKEGILYIVLVDVSRSLTVDAFELLRKALLRLAEGLGPHDSVVLYRFGDKVSRTAGPTADGKLLVLEFGKLQATENRTALHDALREGLQLAATDNAAWPRRRAVVVLSDGEDDGSSFTMEDVRRQLERSRVPVFVTGYRRSSTTPSPGLNALRNLAAISGGHFEEALPAQVQTVHERIQAAVREVHVARLACSPCPTDGQNHRLSISFRAAGASATDTIDMRLPYIAVAEQKPSRRNWLLLAGAGAVLLAVGLAIQRRRRARRQRAAAGEAASGSALSGGPQPHEHAIASEPGGSHAVGSDLPSVRLVCTVVHGATRGQQFALVLAGDPLIAGSAPDCDVVLERDRDVADRHFELRNLDGAVYAKNLAPVARTRLNGVPLSGQMRVADGDLLGAGSTDLRVRFGAR
jgi:hypothetical protein